MPTMIHYEELKFNDLEKIIFQALCSAGAALTKEILESLDAQLAESRDKKTYRNKGKRTTTIKTRYGEVTYRRNVYEYADEDGKHCKYLLDDELEINNTGLISPDLVSLILEEALKKSFRQTATSINEMTGIRISPMTAWHIVQKLGEKAVENDRKLCEANKAGLLRGEVETPILFEEADGTFISMQGESRKGTATGKREVKISATYTGWKLDGGKRHALQNRLVTAGICSAKEFEEQRQARMASTYDMDGVECRIFNSDGGGWLKRLRTDDVIFQLDQFHIHKAVKEQIKNRDAVREIEGLLKEQKTDELFRFLELYANSVESEEEYEGAVKLYEYLYNNRDGLVPYDLRGLELPEPREGEFYRRLGTMEGHVRNIIGCRMKRNQSSWSLRGADHMCRLLAMHSSGTLSELMTCGGASFEDLKVVEEDGEIEITSAAKVPKSVGKGYKYPVTGHISLLDEALHGSRAGLLGLAGFLSV